MDAALITRMFNVGYSVNNEPPKDVLIKKDSDFKDVLSKNMKDVNDENKVEKKEVKNEDNVKTKDVDNEKVKDKEVKRKDKKDDKKVKDSNETGTENVNGLIEQKLKDVEEIQDLESLLDTETQDIELNLEDVNLQDKINKGLGESIDEVGPQSVETEKMTLDEFEKLESKLDSLAEMLGRTNEDDELSINREVESEGSTKEDNSLFDENKDNVADFMENSDVENKEVKSKDSKFKITDLREKNTFNNNFELNEMDVKSENIEIPKFDITGNSNVIMSKADKLQEQIDVLKQITEKVDVHLLEDKSEMLIKLKPDNLGKVTMQVSIENGNISAKFLAESEKVKEILESNMQELKDQLAKQGMVVQDLNVSVGNDDRERQMFEGRNVGTFNRHSRINRIENDSYSTIGEVYEDNDENLAYYWPDSTVSFSA